MHLQNIRAVHTVLTTDNTCRSQHGLKLVKQMLI